MLRLTTASLALLVLLLLVRSTEPAEAPAVKEITITQDTTVEKDAVISGRIVIKASNITIDGNGATLTGPGKIGDAKALEKAGVGISAEGCSNVTIRNLKAKGFATGLKVTDGKAWKVEGCDFSDNYHNPDHGWGELPARGGILLTRVSDSVFRKNKANNVWDALHLIESDGNLFEDNDFSHCSNTCAKLWTSCRTRFLGNNLSYGIRIDRSKKEVHARDSTCVLIETGSNDNYFYKNDITYGGDGLFIRVLNGWVSTGNVFVENDTSHANNNCVESWSPGNTYIRNKANHGSYGFWLGGSDQTRLIGNEAAYNGMPDGNHHAAEPGFSHGGIVIVGGSSSHTVIDGNHCHHNNGGGIVFRGDTASKGEKWRTHHWIVQNNNVHDNQFGIWGEWGDWIHLGNNTFKDNPKGNHLKEVTHLIEAKPDEAVKQAPLMKVLAPSRAKVGQPVAFDASACRDPAGKPLSFRWDLGGDTSEKANFSHTFTKPGFYRVGVTASNGVLADLDFRDLIVSADVKDEIGTEGQAARWGYEFPGERDKKFKVLFEDSRDAVVGKSSLRWTPNPYNGIVAAAVYPASKDAGWDLSGKKKLSFWIKTQNPNLGGFQDAGPVITLFGKEGSIILKPITKDGKDDNLLVHLPFSEARWTWRLLEVPLTNSPAWKQETKGKVSLEKIDALSIGLDSWGGDPFFVWLDGLCFE